MTQESGDNLMVITKMDMFNQHQSRRWAFADVAPDSSDFHPGNIGFVEPHIANNMLKVQNTCWLMTNRRVLSYQISWKFSQSNLAVWDILYKPTSKKGRGNTIAPWSQDSNLPLKFLTIREWESVLKAALVRLAGPSAGGFGPNNVGICRDIQLLTVERSPSCVRTTKHNKSECSMLAQMAYMPIKKGPSICKNFFIHFSRFQYMEQILTMAHDSKRLRFFHSYVCW